MAKQGYQGPGKVVSTIGGWFVGGLVGGLIGTAMVALAPLSVGVALAAAAIVVASNIGGAYAGYKYAAAGERQYEATRAVAEERILQVVRDQDHGPQVGAKRFAEQMKPKPNVYPSHADAVLAERENGLAQQAR